MKLQRQKRCFVNLKKLVYTNRVYLSANIFVPLAIDSGLE